jgi:hypothetical protein
MGWRWGVLALNPLRTESTYHQMQYLLSCKPPALLWTGVRVRLVVDNVLPVGRSV